MYKRTTPAVRPFTVNLADGNTIGKPLLPSTIQVLNEAFAPIAAQLDTVCMQLPEIPLQLANLRMAISHLTQGILPRQFDHEKVHGRTMRYSAAIALSGETVPACEYALRNHETVVNAAIQTAPMEHRLALVHIREALGHQQQALNEALTEVDAAKTTSRPYR